MDLDKKYLKFLWDTSDKCLYEPENNFDTMLDGIHLEIFKTNECGRVLDDGQNEISEYDNGEAIRSNKFIFWHLFRLLRMKK